MEVIGEALPYLETAFNVGAAVHYVDKKYNKYKLK